MQTTDERLVASVEGLVHVRDRKKEGKMLINRTSEQLRDQYELQSVIQFIVNVKTPKYRIALQFPESLLCDSVAIVGELQSLLTADHGRVFGPPTAEVISRTQIFVVADTTFGDCCPDEITAQHYKADCIVHFGYACLSRTCVLPVHYVFSKWDFNVDQCALQIVFCASSVDDLIVVLSASTIHAEGKLRAKVQQLTSSLPQGGKDKRVSFATFDPSTQCLEGCSTSCISSSSSSPQATVPSTATKGSTGTAGDPSWVVNGFRFPRVMLAEDDDAPPPRRQRIFFVGPTDSPQLHQLSLIAVYNDGLDIPSPPTTGEESESTGSSEQRPSLTIFDSDGPDREEEMEEGKLDSAAVSVQKHQAVIMKRMRQRMFNIETLKEASAVGIIVASLAIQGHRETAEKLRTLLIRHHKRCYIIYIGHLNPFKVGNFVDSIDCFVTVACPNSRLAHFTDKNDEFLKPLCAPIEVLMALDYVDFCHSAASTTHFDAVLGINCPLGRSRSEGGEDGEGEEEGKGAATAGHQLITSRPLNVAVRGETALQRLNEREYKGLDPAVGQTPVQDTILEGRHGIARGYETTSKEE